MAADSNDWNTAAERIDTRGTESFYTTWDNNNLYLNWSGRALDTADLFVYINTAPTGGATSTWTGGNTLPTPFNGANYVFYCRNSSTDSLLSGSSPSVYAHIRSAERCQLWEQLHVVRIPFSDIGNPDSIKIIPFMQNKSGSQIVSSFPNNGVSQFVRNPVGVEPQPFLSWIKFKRSILGLTPVASSAFDSVAMNRPTWTYSFGSGNFVSSIMLGTGLIYVSVGGASPNITCLTQRGFSNGRILSLRTRPQLCLLANVNEQNGPLFWRGEQFSCRI